MSDWLRNLLGYMLVVSVALQMLPNKKYEQYLRLFTGFLLIILVLQPILKIGSAGSVLEEKINAFVQEQEELERQIVSQAEAFETESQKKQEWSQMQIEIEPVAEIDVEVTMDGEKDEEGAGTDRSFGSDITDRNRDSGVKQ